MIPEIYEIKSDIDQALAKLQEAGARVIGIHGVTARFEPELRDKWEIHVARKDFPLEKATEVFGEPVLTDPYGYGTNITLRHYWVMGDISILVVYDAEVDPSDRSRVRIKRAA